MHAAAIDDAAQGLLFAWDQAREQVTPRLSWPQLNALLAVERAEGINLGGLAAVVVYVAYTLRTPGGPRGGTAIPAR